MQQIQQPLTSARATSDIEELWPIKTDFRPPGWSHYLKCSKNIIDLVKFPTICDWQVAFSKRPELAGYKLQMQNTQSKRERRTFKNRTGLTPLGYYLNSIVNTKEVLFRPDNWHDFFNNLVWISFPTTKITLHRLAFQYYTNRNGNGNRQPEEDLLTRFDEGGSIEYGGPKTRTNIIFGHGFLEALFFQKAKQTSPLKINLAIKTPSTEAIDLVLADFISKV